MLRSSARVGSLILPARSLFSYLARFSSQLTIWSYHDVHRISIRGSAIGLIHNGRPMLVCSRHQTKDVDPRDVGIILPDGKYMISSSGFRSCIDSDDTRFSDAYDIAAFRFIEPANEYPEISRGFFRFDQIPPDTTNESIVAFVVSGYPSGDISYEVEERKHIGFVRRVRLAIPDSQPTDSALLKLKFLQELDFDPDGLSGGPAFVVIMIDGDFHAFLGGMILRAGRTHLYVLKSGYIWMFLETF